MDSSAKIFVAGHRGMVGSALLRRLQDGGYTNLLVRPRGELDLLDQARVRDFMRTQRPDYVFLAAAKVGGILAHANHPADFIQQNLVITTNVIHEAFNAGVQYLLFIASSAVYPRDCPQPMREDYLFGGSLEPTHAGYALAKLAGLKLCETYNRQYGTRYIGTVPTNLYGPNDNFDLASSHVVPALLRKIHEAKQAQAVNVTLWGSGNARREFLHVDDMADACVFLMERDAGYGPYNIGQGNDITVRELAQSIVRLTGYDGELLFDRSKPDGAPRKLLDVSRLGKLGWSAKRSLIDGLAETYAWYCRQAA